MLYPLSYGGGHIINVYGVSDRECGSTFTCMTPIENIPYVQMDSEATNNLDSFEGYLRSWRHRLRAANKAERTIEKVPPRWPPIR